MNDMIFFPYPQEKLHGTNVDYHLINSKMDGVLPNLLPLRGNDKTVSASIHYNAFVCLIT